MTEQQEQVIGLAAAAQALYLVNEVANKGDCDKYLVKPVLNALVTYSPDNTLEAYGGNIENIKFGLNYLGKLLNNEADRNVTSYLLGILNIEMKLVNSSSILDILRSDLQEITINLNNLDDESTNLDLDDIIDGEEAINQFASTYKRTASTIEPRIMIKGDGNYLQQIESANKIRALLLAALRGVSFFRHYGGNRMQVMLKRKEILKTIKQLAA